MGAKDARAGYRIERIYVAEQEYKSTDSDDASAADQEEEREVDFGWDWRPVGPRRFEVAIKVSVAPVSWSPDEAKVSVMATFTAAHGDLSVSFEQFIKQHAPAILFPFAREVISAMTGRGPHGAYHVHPINVVQLLDDAELANTAGHKFLLAHQDLIEDFGLYDPRQHEGLVTEG